MPAQSQIVCDPDAELVAIITADRDGVIRGWNAAAARIFGYAPAEAIGRTIDFLIPPEERGDHWHAYRRVIETNLINYSPEHVLDIEGVRKDGTRVHLDAMLIACHDGAGHIKAVTAEMREMP